MRRVLHNQRHLSTFRVDRADNPIDQVFNTSDWESHIKAQGWLLEPPEIDYEFLNFTPSAEDLALVKRGDCDNTVLITQRTETFVDWDVQMSPVICANGDMTVAITEGYSVSNSVSVSAGLDVTFIAEQLRGSLGIDYTRTWTTSALTAVTGTVKDKECGCMIWKPMTSRRYGNVMKGCIGALRKVGTFQADNRGEASYNGMRWVAGARSMCRKPGNNPPLSRCQGGGNFI